MKENKTYNIYVLSYCPYCIRVWIATGLLDKQIKAYREQHGENALIEFIDNTDIRAYRDQYGEKELEKLVSDNSHILSEVVLDIIQYPCLVSDDKILMYESLDIIEFLSGIKINIIETPLSNLAKDLYQAEDVQSRVTIISNMDQELKLRPDRYDFTSPDPLSSLDRDLTIITSLYTNITLQDSDFIKHTSYLTAYINKLYARFMLEDLSLQHREHRLSMEK